jgi:hypothetical protein
MKVQKVRPGRRGINADLMIRGEEQKIENRQRQELEAQDRRDLG